MSEEVTAIRTVDGVVTSTKMDKTITVTVMRRFRHPRYGKFVKRRTKYYVHNELPVQVGDVVRMVHTRPLSKLKRWKTIEVLSKGAESK